MLKFERHSSLFLFPCFKFIFTVFSCIFQSCIVPHICCLVQLLISGILFLKVRKANLWWFGQRFLSNMCIHYSCTVNNAHFYNVFRSARIKYLMSSQTFIQLRNTSIQTCLRCIFSVIIEIATSSIAKQILWSTFLSFKSQLHRLVNTCMHSGWLFNWVESFRVQCLHLWRSFCVPMELFGQGSVFLVALQNSFIGYNFEGWSFFVTNQMVSFSFEFCIVLELTSIPIINEHLLHCSSLFVKRF